MERHMLERYWRNTLHEKIVNIFVYNHLPDDIPAGVYEQMLIKEGSFTFFSSDGKFYVMNTAGVGVTPYTEYGYFAKEQGSNPVLGTFKGTDGEDCVLVRNNTLRQNMNLFIARYAELLVSIDLTFICACENVRPYGLIVTKNEKIKKQVSDFFKAMRNGKNMAVTVDEDFNSVIGQEKMNVYPFKDNSDIRMLRDVQRNVLKDFYSDIGVKTSKEKRERELTGEVDADDSMLLFNISDMLACRQEGWNRINKMYGTNVEVDINPAFEIIGENNASKKNEDNNDIQ